MFAVESLVDLIAESELILYGRIIDVHEGFSPENIPYTEISLSVAECLKGQVDEIFRFSQFGLRNPNGRNVGPDLYPKPASLPSWNTGEDVLVFLHPPVRLTGFRTPVGLADGKWRQAGDYLVSESDLSAILDGVSAERIGLTAQQREMLARKESRVRFAPMMDLLRRAIEEHWIEKGLLVRAP